VKIGCTIFIIPLGHPMPLSLHELQQDRLHHARWRVTYRRSLLESHLATACVGSDWEYKEQELRQWLEEARAELRRVETVQRAPMRAMVC
jgi:hypothetical protein